MRLTLYRIYTKHFLNCLKKNNLPNAKTLGEEQYLAKWKRLAKRVEPYSYRLFSHYCGQTPDIVPEDIGHSIIEAHLNPKRFRPFYQDKNLYDTYVPDGVMPTTIARRMGNGILMGKDYKPLLGPLSEALASFDRVVLKPTLDSDSGRGVMLFVRKGDEWQAIGHDGITLNEQFLLGYGPDFILQEALTQHPDIAKYNPTSVNTLRVATYRSVVDEEVHVLASIMRIGKSGAVIDNAHAGGMYIGIDISTGKLMHRLFDQFGQSISVWNGYDFSTTDNTIPHWDRVLNKVKEIASRVHHMRLLAFDISVDAAGNPRMVEFNVSWYSYWLFMFTNQKPLGSFSDEIIDYCKGSKPPRVVLELR